MTLKMDSGQSIKIDLAKHPHLNQGYAVTSHSSQGQTADASNLMLMLKRG